MWFLLAICGTICFGLRGIMYQWTSQKYLNRNFLLVGVYFTGTIVAIIGTFILGQSWDKSVFIGIFMGIFSYLSNATVYKGYSVAKASIIALFAGMPPLVVIVLAYFAWGEKLNLLQLSSFIIIMTGLLMVRYSNEISLRNMKGAQWGILAMFFFGITDFSTKQATLLNAPVFPTLSVMFISGTLCALLFWGYGEIKDKKAKSILNEDHNEIEATDQKNNSFASLKTILNNKTWPHYFTFLFGMIIGITNILGMVFALKAFDKGISGLVSAVLAANVIFVMLYARVILKDKFTKLESMGLLTAVTGLILLKTLE